MNRPLPILVCILFALTASAVELPNTPPAGVQMAELLAASIYDSPDVDIAVPNGTYTLQLLLYEGWKSRSADIVIEGKTVRTAYDMFKEQGANFDHGSVLRHTFTLIDGNIDIQAWLAGLQNQVVLEDTSRLQQACELAQEAR